MSIFPGVGFLEKLLGGCRTLRQLHIGVYAANACYFIVLAVFPTLVLLLGLLRYTPLEAESLAQILHGLLPDQLLAHLADLIFLAHEAVSGTVLRISALGILWSAGKGVYGLMAGLNGVYGVAETRNYFHRRALSVGYTFAFLLVLVLTLGLYVFGAGLGDFAQRGRFPLLVFLTRKLNFRFLLLIGIQTVVFCAMYSALPNRKSRFREGLPGAMLASLGWLGFSRLYSVYMETFARLTNVYGSVYAVALSMLWLYCCISIVFYGGALNRYLQGWDKGD